MSNKVDDVRIKSVRPLLPAAILHEELPESLKAIHTVSKSREEIESVLEGKNDRLVVIVGPCSIHDPDAALAYASLLKPEKDKFSDDLIIVMRTYFEKPRTTIGWKGLVNDPYMNGTFRVNEGLRLARKLLLQLNEMGVPCGSEFLDTSLPQHLADLVAWGAIGARTTESQVHREMASGLSMPVGFKNATDGGIQVAVDAILAAQSSHWFAGATKDGVSALIETTGNPYCHLILRGGTQSGPNFSAEHVTEASAFLLKNKLPQKVMIDLSHGNSLKDHTKQLIAGEDVAGQIKSGDRSIFGVMIESFLQEGRQDISKVPLDYGKSVTDACLSFEQTLPMFEKFALAVKGRRQLS